MSRCVGQRFTVQRMNPGETGSFEDNHTPSASNSSCTFSSSLATSQPAASATLNNRATLMLSSIPTDAGGLTQATPLGNDDRRVSSLPDDPIAPDEDGVVRPL